MCLRLDFLQNDKAELDCLIEGFYEGLSEVKMFYLQYQNDYFSLKFIESCRQDLLTWSYRSTDITTKL